MSQDHMFELSMKRPLDYHDLSAKEQWRIDKELGILDWDGCKTTQEQINRYHKHFGLDKRFGTMEKTMTKREILESALRSEAVRGDDNFVSFRERVDVAAHNIHEELFKGNFKHGVKQQLTAAVQDAYLRGYRAAEAIKRKR